MKIAMRQDWIDACAINRKFAEARAKKDENGVYGGLSLQDATASEFAWGVAETMFGHGTLMDDDIFYGSEPIKGEMAAALDVQEKLKQSRVIVFSPEQAQVFMDCDISPIGIENYNLPFDNVFLHFPGGVSFFDFSTDLYIKGERERGEEPFRDNAYFRIESLLISRVKVDEQDYELLISFQPEENQHDPNDFRSSFWCPSSLGAGAKFYSILELSESFRLNTNILNYRDSDKYKFLDDAGMARELDLVRKLANACIGYINCDNIYLAQDGIVPDKVNRKRAKQGKTILEPYYVCRIRGVQYDSNGEPTGEGTHHGFRYDVRGHFRKLTSGKTTWVRPHQRGLQNELYIPKTYVVAKEPVTP